MSLIKGKAGIEAECLLRTKGDYAELCTLRIRFPRFVAEQFLKHRMFSCNAVSSRAMSVPKMNKWIEDHPAEPLFWGAQQKGMQPKRECINYINLYESRERVWEAIKHQAMHTAELYWEAGYHQQIPNRLTHPFQMAEYIVTATDWGNFFNLRLHDEAAQSEIQELARCMYRCIEAALLQVPHEGWHLPYVTRKEKSCFTLAACKVLSAARCAIISYNNHDTEELLTIDKAHKIYDHLISDTNPHLTPCEHQARVLFPPEEEVILQAQNTPYLNNRKAKQLEYYANLHGWVSHRYELEEKFND